MDHETGKEDFTQNRQLTDLDFQLLMLSHLNVAYGEIGLKSDEIQIRIQALQEQRKTFDQKTNLSRTVEFNEKCGNLINISSEKLRTGSAREALSGYLIALNTLQNDFQDFQSQALADLNESIADSYLALGNKKMALKSFENSMNAHFDYEPNDRAFQIHTKIARLNQELYPDNFAQLNQLMVQNHFDRLSKKVGIYDQRLNNLKRMIAMSYVLNRRYKDAFLVYDSLIDENHAEDGQFKKLAFDRLSKEEKTAVQTKEYVMETVQETSLDSLRSDVKKLGLAKQIRIETRSDGKLICQVSQPSQFLKKEVREKLGIDRVRVAYLDKNRLDFMQRNIPHLAIEVDHENQGKFLLTFPKNEKYRKLIQFTQTPEKWVKYQSQTPHSRIKPTSQTNPKKESSEVVRKQ